MIKCYKFMAFTMCSLGIIIMCFFEGCGENPTNTYNKDLSETPIKSSGIKFPIPASEPCPLKNIRIFTLSTSIISRENTAKYYLVDIDRHPLKIVIYILEDRLAMDQAHYWLEENGKRLAEKSTVALNPSTLPWHEELLQFDKN